MLIFRNFKSYEREFNDLGFNIKFLIYTFCSTDCPDNFDINTWVLGVNCIQNNFLQDIICS